MRDNRNFELIDGYINIICQNEQEIKDLNTELNDRDSIISNLETELSELKLKYNECMKNSVM